MSGAQVARIAMAVALGVTDAVIVGDPQLRVVGLNAPAERLLGRGDDNVVGSDIGDVLCGDGERPSWFSRLLGRGDGGVSEPVVLQPGPNSRVTSPVSVRATRIDDHHVVVASTMSGAEQHVRRRVDDLETGLRRIAWELQALGVTVGGVATPPPLDAIRDLSRREREVLDAFAAGASVGQTAEDLCLSEHTVRSHLKAIYRKLGVRGQTELMRRLTQRE